VIPRASRAAALAGALAVVIACAGPEPAGSTVSSEPVRASVRETSDTPPSPAAGQLMRSAIESYRAGEFDQALDSAAAALTDSPASVEPYRLVSKIFTDTGRNRGGIEYFSKMTRREGHRWQPWLYMGYHQFHLNLWEEALESFQRAAQLDPGNAESRWRSGMILEYRGDLDGAAADFRAAYDLEPGKARYATRYAKSLRMGGDYAAAERTIADALAATPDSGPLHYALGQIRLRQARFDEAREALERAVEIDPRHAGAHKDLAGVLARAGHEADARRELATAERLNDYDSHRRLLLERVGVMSGDPTLPLLLAELELTERRFPQAVEWYARAEALAGASVRIRAGRAEALFGRGRFDAARLELAGLPDPGGPRVRLARAAGAVAEGDLAAARGLTEAALAEAPADRDFLRRAADLLRAAGTPSEAAEVLARAASTPRPPIP
jgi:tetratricopeptide (TPR) repeat protein